MAFKLVIRCQKCGKIYRREIIPRINGGGRLVCGKCGSRSFDYITARRKFFSWKLSDESEDKK